MNEMRSIMERATYILEASVHNFLRRSRVSKLSPPFRFTTRAPNDWLAVLLGWARM
jgi:hypothetical protein